MRSLAALPAALLLLSAVPAHAAIDLRWPWEPPKPAPERRDDRDRDYDHRERDRDPGRHERDREYRQPEYRADSYDAQFVERMLANTREQLALAELAASRSHNREVRDMAQRTLHEAGALEQTLLRRADELGMRVKRDRGHVSLPQGGGWELDLAYLRATLDVIALERPYFASYKSSVGGPLHDALQRHWDEMVDRRDDVKALHDRVRNEARRHGANV